MVSQTVDGVKKSLGLIVIIIIIVIAATVMYKIYNATKTGGQVVGDVLGNQILASTTGVPVQRISVVRQAAEDLRSNMTIAWLVGSTMNIDEERWIEIINRSVKSAQEAKMLSQFFRELTGKSLRTEINDSFSASEKSKIANVYQNID
jgi:hypothetical protein